MMALRFDFFPCVGGGGNNMICFVSGEHCEHVNYLQLPLEKGSDLLRKTELQNLFPPQNQQLD